jgi:hypothetical protein
MPFRITLVAVLLLSLSGCATWNEDAGVENRWRADETPQWVAGQTTASDVLQHLGPPSQIVNLRDQVVYYYLRENLSGSGYFFLVYNKSESATRYDRAVFFFDEGDVLIRHAYSNEVLAREKE